MCCLLDYKTADLRRAVLVDSCPLGFVPTSLLLRAGAHISAEEIYRICRSGVLPDPLGRYLFKVIAAGGFTAYERAHRARLVAMLVPKLTHMPADNIPLVVDFWCHVGFY